MSDGGKPRQPSSKHALDEVLKGLQDLVRNELADERVATESPRRAAPTRPTTPTRPAPATPKVEDIPVLTDPIGHAPPGAKAGTRAAVRAPVAAAVAKPVPAGGLQTELPLPLDPDPLASAEDIPVLQHVVVPPSAPRPRESAAAATARRIAHEVAARLAAEPAGAGTSRLEPAIIRRLEDLLREALEKQAAASPRS